MRDDPISDCLRRPSLERDEGWREIIPQIPALKFKPSWSVAVIPPFGGAVARFWITKGNAKVSVYLDWFSRIGCMDDPYYEIYPAPGGDVARFLLNEGDEMIQEIEKSLAGQNRNRK